MGLNRLINSVAQIIRSVIGISYYLLYQYQLFLKDVTNIVKSVLIMSFFVIIASLIAFLIFIIEKILIFIERIKNQRVDRCRCNI